MPNLMVFMAAPKVRYELLNLGLDAGKHQVAHLMQKLGLKGCPEKRYRVTTQSDLVT